MFAAGLGGLRENMEIIKIRELNDAELKAEEAKAGELLFRVRFEKGLGNTEGIRKLRELKRDIARMKTIARQRQLAQASAASQKAKA